MSGPPPPYDSVVAGDHHPFFSGTNFTGAPTGGATGGPSRAFDIAVVDPIKQGEGMGAHVCYKVRTKTTQPGYARPVNEVRRRFRDFSVLADVLAERYKGAILPPLPDKSTVQKFQMGPEFIEMRRKALQVFIIKVASHPLLQSSRELQTFLEASDDEWLLASAGWTAEVAAASKPTVNNAVAWFKSLQHSAQSLVSGRSDDALEDHEYLKVRDYINALEGHLSEAHRQAARLVRKEAELGAALAEFGLAAEQLGKYDEGGLRPALDALGGRATSIATLSRQRSEALTAEFEAPLKEFARGIKSVQAAMADRAVALAAFGQAKSDLEGKKVRLAKMRATPGLREDKISEAERDVTDAEQKLRNAKIGYESIVSRMTEELNRFQKERASEMTTVLKQFALAQAQASAEQAQAWGQFLEELQQQQAAVAAVPPQGGAVAASG